MENFPQSVSINMQPYGRNRAGSPATAFGPTITSFVQPEPVPNPQDFVLWSFFNTLFGNFFCLGFVALIFSIKVSQKSPPVPPLLCLARGSRLLPAPMPGLPNPISSWLILSHPTESHPVPSCPTPSHPVPSCPKLPHPHLGPHLRPPQEMPPHSLLPHPAPPCCSAPNVPSKVTVRGPPVLLWCFGKGGPGQRSGSGSPPAGSSEPRTVSRQWGKVGSQLLAPSHGAPEIMARLRPYLR
ncbi:proline-rich protein HaeIII subfamily 1-like isoform X1 [Aquila chrysaetos chrysaetos]|uniref:proline-rich protein HaeIII subfamily 1-like isoform X1 n=1 Tax=Aquila chrysaetos chrysaetos TaxID=223781 RepID=UPI0005D08900|nr:proline-rich protein HaeIII subfamily 1-like isoform X1 [Aquila chrysaetos chrysaetos]